MPDENDERVGYKRPPKKSQFRSGKSGNPTGRPKRPPSFRSEILAELGTSTVVDENGRQVEISKQRAIAKALVAAAAGGDLRAIAAIMNFATRTPTDEGEHDLTPEEEEILEAHLCRKNTKVKDD